MTARIRTALRKIFLTWDRYTALQFNAPLTHELVRRSTPAVAR
jgi:hypothetical protein